MSNPSILFYLLPALYAAVLIVLAVLVIWTLVLSIRALRIYIKKNSVARPHD